MYLDHFSQPCRAVHAFCVEAGIPFTIRETRLAKGENLHPDFLRINPWGTVPAIVHNNHCIYESHAILVYLCENFPVPDHWYPKCPEKRLKLSTYLHWHHINVRVPFGNYIFNKFFGPRFFGTPFSQEINDVAVRLQEQTLLFLDDMLETKFVAGLDEVSIGDLSCYCELSQLYIDRYNFARYKNVAKWMKQMKEIKGMKAAHAVFDKLSARIKI